MKAVITAGGRIDGPFAQAAGTRVKGLAPVRGQTMLARMIASLRSAGATRIAVVGGDEVRAACGAHVDRFVDESVSGSENLLRALRAWPEDGETLLYATSDLPYVTPEAIEAFAVRVPSGALAVALAEFPDFVRRFPDAPPSYGITLAGERVVNGGVFLLPEGSTQRIATVAARFFDARKRPWQMANLVSPIVLIRFLLRRVSVADLEAMAVRVLQLPARAVRHSAPELAYDVDTFAEYDYACAHG
ncbi:MAG TPA: nucleotidyltransferase family protein [Candidatus Cybelea sp.]